MADGLSDADIQLFGSISVFTRQLMFRTDEYLELIGLPYVLGHSHPISSTGGSS